jgi:hypothetical protein
MEEIELGNDYIVVIAGLNVATTAALISTGTMSGVLKNLDNTNLSPAITFSMADDGSGTGKWTGIITKTQTLQLTEQTRYYITVDSNHGTNLQARWRKPVICTNRSNQ